MVDLATEREGMDEKDAQIEVTPEMLEAGVGAWLEWTYSDEDAEDLVTAVYRSMVLASSAK